MNREVLVDMIHLRKKLERAKDIKVSLAWLEEYTSVSNAYQLLDDISSKFYQIERELESLEFLAEVNADNLAVILKRATEAHKELEEVIQKKECEKLVELVEKNQL